VWRIGEADSRTWTPLSERHFPGGYLSCISSHCVPSVTAVQRLRVEAGPLAGPRYATDLALRQG
jgi:hypothetical protein